ncbi:hypothetical protein [Staphylococcus capitis]|uniref:hypothetical protein n=1 Tax=Staphylococcus capitis TaxID=29388 RepID=UPI00145A32B0|nr:hypothetical protein [Staphylococcus capitis]MBW4835855.1 hypothetical protein [Staphylococcaceae bacterium]MBW4843047.1 hypothetical protein [Staphylococcaceae bacterium]NMK83384.1 hypothetical protein [Staphylococcus capitis]
MNQIDKWNYKFNALPRIPRSQSNYGYVDTIKTIFHKIITNSEIETVVKKSKFIYSNKKGYYSVKSV